MGGSGAVVGQVSSLVLFDAADMPARACLASQIKVEIIMSYMVFCLCNPTERVDHMQTLISISLMRLLDCI